MPGRLFTAFGDLIDQGQQAGVLPPGNPERLRLLLIATLQGIATLVTSRQIHAGQVDALVTDAIALFTRDRPAARQAPYRDRKERGLASRMTTAVPRAPCWVPAMGPGHPARFSGVSHEPHPSTSHT